MRHRLLAGISSAALLACGPSASAATTTFLFTGAVQTFTAPTTGTYQFLAFGAQGGSGGATGRPAAAATAAAATTAVAERAAARVTPVWIRF
jgi:hypothetical protein